MNWGNARYHAGFMRGVMFGKAVIKGQIRKRLMEKYRIMLTIDEDAAAGLYIAITTLGEVDG